MTDITMQRPGFAARFRRGAHAGAALALLATVAGCDGATGLVRVTDPDIITPETVNSAAAAQALRLGAISRFNTYAGGGENMFLYGGLMADEFESGDTFIERNQIDLRSVAFDQNGNVDGGYRQAQRTRVGAQQALRALNQFDPTGPAWTKAEMYMIEAYMLNQIAEHFCNGVPLSTVVDGVEQPGGPVTTTAMYQLAVAKYDSALTLLGTAADAESNRVRNIVRTERGRTLMNLNRPADALAAVQGVPATFVWNQEFTPQIRDNSVWNLNINQRRYQLGAAEAGVGLPFFGNTDPRVPSCLGGDTRCRQVGAAATNAFNNAAPIRVQLVFPERTTPVPVVTGTQARLIAAEAVLRAGNGAAAIDSLNAIRRTAPNAATLNLAPLTDPGTQDGRIDLLFREKAFWQFGTGKRFGELRRLIRQYNRPANTVFPSGRYQGGTQTYGTDVTFPIPQSEQNNPAFGPQGTCIDRNA